MTKFSALFGLPLVVKGPFAERMVRGMMIFSLARSIVGAVGEYLVEIATSGDLVER